MPVVDMGLAIIPDRENEIAFLYGGHDGFGCCIEFKKHRRSIAGTADG
jgi:hypothetical protein